MSVERVQNHSPELRSWRFVAVAFTFTVIAGAGIVYLNRQQIEPPLKPAAIETQSLKQAPTEMQPGAASIAIPARLPAPKVAPPGFDAVSADEIGSLIAAGKAEPGFTVLLKDKSRTLGKATADENGEWIVMLEHLPAGDYALSLQAIDPKTQQTVSGQKTFALTIAPPLTPAKSVPANRVSTAVPVAAMERPQAGKTAIPQEEAEAAQKGQIAIPKLVAATEPPASKGREVARVKRGDSLWAIARKYYKSGSRYSEIVNANKPQIKNPDLIFPNQQFQIPPSN